MDNKSNDTYSLSHTSWKCQYHIVFAPKYRRKAIYLLLHYFMFTHNSGLTHAFILIAAGLLLTMGVLRLLRYHRSRNRSRRGAWS